MLYQLDDKQVQLPENYFIAESAAVIGNVALGNDVSIWFNALVTENMEILDDLLVMGSHVKIKRNLSFEQQQALEKQTQHYVQNGHRFKKGLIQDNIS